MMKEKIIIGRKSEIEILNDILSSNQPELVAITGRRRVGKTYLIKTFFKDKLVFEFTGVLNASLKQQLQAFAISLSLNSTPKNWLEAFYMLSKQLEKKKTKKKQVLFIDELPWLDTHKSNFMSALDWFWNSWATKKNVCLIVCGSATSWMINKLINNKGGLHNRVTKRIHLEPFNLHETEAFLKHNGINLSKYQILQVYMSLGGIPHYLKEIKKGESPAQAVHRICFDTKGLLVNEFDNLYHALFTNAKHHIDIIQALATKNKGLTRKEILKHTHMTDGGTFTKSLDELEWSGFISKQLPFGKLKKEALYRLTDEFSLFYLKFIYKKRNVNWNQLAGTQTWKVWSGYTFENICIKHISQIKKALGISAVYTEQGSFVSKDMQIDLLIDRNDHVINMCEIKFYDKPFTITKQYASTLREKMASFENQSHSNKTLFLTFVTSFGVISNEYKLELVQQEVVLPDLFNY
jgi:uncharacterized protein